MKAKNVIDFTEIQPKESGSYITKKEYSAIIGAMRKIFARSDFAKDVRRRALSAKTGKRGGMMIDCAICGEAFSPKDIELHHEPEVVEIGKHYSDYSLDELMSRLWVEHDAIIPLCKECHRKITLEQQEERNRLKRLEKQNEIQKQA